MANISREEDLKDSKERTENNGRRKSGRQFPSTEKADAYNKIYMTNFTDDIALEIYLSRQLDKHLGIQRKEVITKI